MLVYWCSIWLWQLSKRTPLLPAEERQGKLAELTEEPLILSYPHARRKKKTDARDKGYEGTNFDLSSEDDVGGDKEPLTR